MSVKKVALVGAIGLAAATQTFVALQFGAERVQGNVAIPTLLCSVWFAWLYSHDPWWKSWFGRSLMLIALALFLDALATILYRNLGDYPGRSLMLILSADVALAAMVMRTFVLHNEQKKDRRAH